MNVLVVFHYGLSNDMDTPDWKVNKDLHIVIKENIEETQIKNAYMAIKNKLPKRVPYNDALSRSSLSSSNVIMQYGQCFGKDFRRIATNDQGYCTYIARDYHGRSSNDHDHTHDREKYFFRLNKYVLSVSQFKKTHTTIWKVEQVLQIRRNKVVMKVTSLLASANILSSHILNSACQKITIL